MKKDGFDLYKCNKCKIVFVYPQPTLEYLRNEIYSLESGFQKNRAEDVSKVLPSARHRLMYKMIKDVSPKAYILDVGAGGGHFLYWAKKNGFSGRGVELNRRTAESANSQGMEVFDGTLLEFYDQNQNNKFDAVILGEIIEHVNDPRELVDTSIKLLKENGFILITTPNLDCFWSKSTFWLYRIFGIPWSSVTPPYHLFQFSSYNLDTLLREFGFVPTTEKYMKMPALKYELGMLHLLKKYKQTKKIRDFIFMFFSYFIYTCTYFISLLLSPFFSKNFSMLKIYHKK